MGEHYKHLTWRISIHAPREGGDLETLIFPLLVMEFQSTPPVRGATGSKC